MNSRQKGSGESYFLQYFNLEFSLYKFRPYWSFEPLRVYKHLDFRQRYPGYHVHFVIKETASSQTPLSLFISLFHSLPSAKIPLFDQHTKRCKNFRICKLQFFLLLFVNNAAWGKKDTPHKFFPKLGIHSFHGLLGFLYDWAHISFLQKCIP